MCLSKGITGGYLPLSVVLTGAAVYDAFYDEYAQLRAFLHSHSYTGNPLACAAALATLDVFATDAVLARNRELARHLGHRASELLGDLPHVAEVRQRGMIVAAEIARDGNPGTPFDWRERRGLRVYRHALEHEMLLRPIGNVVYFMPPYVITPEQIDRMVEVARDGILAATDDCGGATVTGSTVPAASAAGLEF
jgi:adenosylmethionine-8-amino-7-oxononanoate aminotransferase